MATGNADGRTVKLNDEGFLSHPEEWSRRVAESLATGACKMAGLPKPDGCV
jgi:sulfur relay (sulfurtransferase) DsrC/TusE family protein